MNTVLRRFLRENPDWSLIIVGPEHVDSVISYFSTDVRQQVCAIGRIKRDQLIHLYETCDVLILPSFYESFGLAAAEAMACGCTVIMTKVGIGASLKHKFNAFLLAEPISPRMPEFQAAVNMVVDMSNNGENESRTPAEQDHAVGRFHAAQ